jgi:hypothetical protein
MQLRWARGKVMKYYYAFIMALFCAGCGYGTSLKESLVAYRAAQPCCSSFADLQYRDVAYPSEFSFSIDNQSPVFDFGATGKSRLAAFKLPEVSTPYHLVVRSYVFRDGALGGAVFFPLVTFLDGDKKPIYTSDAAHLKAIASGPIDEPLEPDRVQFAAVIAPPSPDRPQPVARYVVIHTSSDLIEYGGYASQIGPVRVAASSAVPLVIPMPGPAGPAQTNGAPVGFLKLRLEPPRT